MKINQKTIDNYLNSSSQYQLLKNAQMLAMIEELTARIEKLEGDKDGSKK